MNPRKLLVASLLGLMSALGTLLPGACLAATETAPPQWLVDGRLIPAGRALLHEMRDAEQRGLEAADYGAAELERLADSLAVAQPAPGLGAQREAVSLSISAAATRFLRHLERGRVEPAAAGYQIVLPPTATDWSAALHELAGSSDVPRLLDRYEPPFVHFALLKQALARYRELARQPALTPLPELAAPKLQAGAHWAGMPALRRLLVALGDLPAGADDGSELFDTPVREALTRFQARHGLTADGVLGRGTLAALNVPMARRVEQLLWSMERARWLPDPGAQPFILVNIPQYRLFAFSRGEDVESSMVPMNVIVGRAFPESNTPIFAADMRYVVLRPYWDVPRSIATREIVPALRKDSGYADKHRYELVRGQNDSSPVVPVSAAAIEELARGTLRIRQRPGRNNSLGLIKFMLPNQYNVYLHSTPAQSLFGETKRAFSHGCVRLEEPRTLADFVLGPEGEWTPERIAAAMDQEDGPPVRINLKRPMPVIIIYATALAAEDGRVLFFDDVYGHDQRLQALLAKYRAARAPRT